MVMPPSDPNPTKEPPSNLLYCLREIDTHSPSIPRLYISEPFTGDELDHLKRNWDDWSAEILVSLIINGLEDYVKGTIICPSDSEPHAQSNWRQNDKLALNFILQYIDIQELEFIENTAVDTAKDCWDTLEKRHMNLGPDPIRQLQLFREGLSTRFSHSEPLPAQAAKLCDLAKRIVAIRELTVDALACLFILNSLSSYRHLQSITNHCDLAKRIVAMGELTVDALACLFILNSLSSYRHLQSIINHNMSCSTKEKPYTYTDIMRLLENEQRLLEADKARNASTSTALAARTISKTTCANCKKTGHAANFCISPGGGMAGKTIQESKKARREVRDSQRNKVVPSSGS